MTKTIFEYSSTEMIKIWAYWLLIIIIFKIIDHINFAINGGNMNRKWWKNENMFSIITTVISWTLLIAFPFYYFIKFTYWFFK